MTQSQFSAVVPAAGIGSRMGSATPKQYLSLGHQCVLAHTLDALLVHPAIGEIIVVLHPDDHRFRTLQQASDPRISAVTGGAERADSVLAGLSAASFDWVLVHDAARPCLTQDDLKRLMRLSAQKQGGILATPVRDTMKRATPTQEVQNTEDRSNLWHALTPQLFPTEQLRKALSKAWQGQQPITDEASAMEWAGYPVKLVQGCSSNIKITQAEDLALAAFYLQQQNRMIPE